jgi:hypothetical protein
MVDVLIYSAGGWASAVVVWLVVLGARDSWRRRRDRRGLGE